MIGQRIARSFRRHARATRSAEAPGLRLRVRASAVATAVVFALASSSWGREATRLCDFETPADVKAWEFSSGAPRLVEEGATHGRKALEITFDPRGQYHPAYMTWRSVRGDWSGFDALVLDVSNPGAEPIPGTLLIGDQAWARKGRTYWNRHNGSATFAPGRTRWTIPLGGLYRGEAGSRNNDIKTDIDVSGIVRLDFGFGAKGRDGRVVIDDLRLIKVNRPAGIWAFGFGPPDHAVMPGWTGVSNATAYNQQRGCGWGPQGGAPWDGAARDTTFGPALLRNFCEAGGYRFRVDVPAGRYRVMVIYENSGYWGGEQAMQSKRRILADGKEVWSEKRADGSAHALWRFEDVEPVGPDGKPVDLWDTYMKAEMARPAVFEATAGADGLTLQFEADRPWGSKVSALALHRDGDAEAARWLAGQMDELAAEFRSMAVCLDKPAARFDLPAAWRSVGLIAWPVRIEEEVTPAALPPETAKGPDALVLSRLAPRDEIAVFCLALRAARTFPDCRAQFRWTKRPGEGNLPAEVSLVWYNTSRGFNSIAYRIRGHTLRPLSAMSLAKDLTRELVLRVRVPRDAPPSIYEGQLSIRTADATLTVPVRLKVSSVALDRESYFRMGFFGLEPPGLLPKEQRDKALDQTLAMLREYGMNMVSGGPNWRLKGWKDGQPVIDFGEMDSFFALLKKHGFTDPVNGYGGCRFAGLHDGYQKGRAGEQVEKESGLPYAEALWRAWKAVDAHARSAGWPTVWYAMCDETRVRDVAERELDFMKMMAKVSAAFPRTVRTSGSYSVSFAQRPRDPADLAYWHQRFFEALDISDLNAHDPSVLAEANRLDKEVHIYNQGTSRYSFGLYQWSEFRRGVKARTQWHLNVLHGYQFFDLDGREPDTAMICYGRRGLYPTISFERCREGAQDFYLFSTLWKLIEKARREGRKDAAVEAAAALLEQATLTVNLNQRRPPEGSDPDRLKAQVIAAMESLMGGG